MKKLDLHKQLKHLYAPGAGKVERLVVPALQFAMIDGVIERGQGPSTSASFQEAVQALYGIAYTLKFASRLRPTNPIDYPVMPLEGLWWSGKGDFAFDPGKAWRWTAMILQPDHITRAMFARAVEQLAEKRDSPALRKLRLERFREGACLQVLHVGPYADEPRTIERMRAFAEENGLAYCGKHHEIYLGDPRRARPEKLRTILRQPVVKAPRRRGGRRSGAAP
jgi:hypothetical protein